MHPNGDQCKERRRQVETAETNIYMYSRFHLNKKLSLSAIHPAVIQALPSVQQALPSLQCTQRRHPTNSPTEKGKATVQKHSFSRRGIPAKIEEFTMLKSTLKAKSIVDVKDQSKTLVSKTFRQEARQVRATKMLTRPKKVSQVLPRIPPKETRTPKGSRTEIRRPPNIQPIVHVMIVTPLATCSVTRLRTIIKEETFSKLAEETTCFQNEADTTYLENRPVVVSGENEAWIKLQLTSQTTRERRGRKEELKIAKAGKQEHRKILKNATVIRPGLRPVHNEALNKISIYPENIANPAEPSEFKPMSCTQSPKYKPVPSLRKSQIQRTTMKVQDLEGSLKRPYTKEFILQDGDRERELPPLEKIGTLPNFDDHLASQKSPWQQLAERKEAMDQFSEREVHRASTDLMTKESKTVLQRVSRREKEDKSTRQPTTTRNNMCLTDPVQSNRDRNLKRAQFEAPSNLCGTTNRSSLRSTAKDRHSVQTLTVKPALPNCQPILVTTASTPPMISTTKKITQRNRPNVKRVHTKTQLKPPLPNIQPILKALFQE
ncbi:hypothetical protein P5673_017705 [Acropora cervicornis]|uniref:Uncharacterized protein n=1 Tax=Acropora cervicornis TaxID=6130 RepID=A0AAD9V378_ACRCE|nr:hypothetical protein P5673_017705 [Acropora cervicornis]